MNFHQICTRRREAFHNHKKNTKRRIQKAIAQAKRFASGGDRTVCAIGATSAHGSSRHGTSPHDGGRKRRESGHACARAAAAIAIMPRGHMSQS